MSSFVGYRISSFLSIFLPTKYMKNDAKVDVPNLAYDLKHAPKICGCYSIRFFMSAIFYYIGINNIFFVALATHL